MSRRRSGGPGGVCARHAGVLFLYSLLITHCSLLIAGCGYRPLGTEGLPANVHSVAIGPIANSTFQAGLQGQLGEALHQRLLADGRVRVRPSTEADAVIETIITGYSNEGVGWDANGVARRSRVQVTAGMILRDRQTYRVLISEGMVGEAYYTAGSGVGTTLAAEDGAARRAVRDLADRVAKRIIEGM
ncbi:MAG TPA: LPS assembly lipoprotein LptE [Candidatus Sulfotelmatobacter sp.]|nr:LPS assembly lipoprotein LptE [Candidatus Sulfotelmatobacter sp.]